MQKNINLLERRRPTGWQSPALRRALLLGAALSVLVAVSYGLQRRELRLVRQELARTQSQAAHLERAMSNTPSVDAVLADRLARQEQEVQTLEALARTLATGGLAHTAGFVPTLQAFGRTTTEGVWLTGLELDNRRGAMIVEGRALDAARVPALLRRLKSDPYFAGTAFSAIELTPGAPDAALAVERALSFRFSTPSADVEARAAGAPAGAAKPAG